MVICLAILLFLVVKSALNKFHFLILEKTLGEMKKWQVRPNKKWNDQNKNNSSKSHLQRTKSSDLTFANVTTINWPLKGVLVISLTKKRLISSVKKWDFSGLKWRGYWGCWRSCPPLFPRSDVWNWHLSCRTVRKNASTKSSKRAFRPRSNFRLGIL